MLLAPTRACHAEASSPSERTRSSHRHLSPRIRLLYPHLSGAALDKGMVLEEPGQPTELVVFPVSGVMSIIVSGEKNERKIEADLFGCDGMIE